MALLQVFVAVFLLMLVGGFSTVAAYEPPRKDIRFAITGQLPPYESRNEHGRLVGMHIALGKALCRQLDVRCTWVDQSFADSIPALEARRFDAILGIAPTPQRRQVMDFTESIYPLTTRLVTRRYSGLIPTVRSLKGRRVGVVRGSNREAFALAHWAPAGVIVKSYWLNDQLIRSLLAGDIDATLQGTLEVRKALLDTPDGQDFDFSGTTVSGEQLGNSAAIGVRKFDTALRDDLNRALAQLQKSGEYQRITQRYLREEPPDPAPATDEGPHYHPGASGLPFSEVVRVGNMLYFSEILGLDSRRNPVRGGVGEQTRQAMNMLREMLERHHSSMEQVVKCTLRLRDIDDLREVNEVYLGYFPVGRLPARSVSSVRNLPRRALVAIDCIALARDQDQSVASEAGN